MSRRSHKKEVQAAPEPSAPKHLSKYAAKKLAQAAAEARGDYYPDYAESEYSSNTVAALHGDEAELSSLHAQRIARAASEGGAGIERGSSFEQEEAPLPPITGRPPRARQAEYTALVAMPGTTVMVPRSRLNDDGTLKKRKRFVKIERKDGRKVKITRKKPQYERDLFVDPQQLAQLPERVAQKRLKRVEHEAQIKEARSAALAKMQAEGRHYDPSPDAVIQNRFQPGTVVTLGIKTQDRTPDYNDPLEIESAKQPHNMRANLLYAPIKRVNKPVEGPDVIAKWLDNWERNNDPEGIFHELLTEVKRVRAEENGIAYVGLPAFLLFLEGMAKRDIIDVYALEFKRFIKRREVSDFIAAMKAPALTWFCERHRFDSAYALLYLDTYPVHFKLGRKRVYVEHELFMIGVTLDGRKDLIGVIPDFTAGRLSQAFWETIFGRIKELGCAHLCYVLAAFKCRFLDRALRKLFPEATLQYNLLEVLQFDSYQLPSEERKEFMADSAQLCASADYACAQSALELMRAKWEPRLPEGTTVLQGNLEYLQHYTALPLPERKLLNTNKMVAHEAALLMGHKGPTDFFSDHAEFLNFLFYRYVIWAKHEWLEHQDEALYNLKFSRLFALLRSQDTSGGQLLDELLTERQQDFMYRHFGQVSSGPIFSLNANRKRIALAGQVEVTASGALQGASWQEPQELSAAAPSADAAPAENAEGASSTEPEADAVAANLTAPTSAADSAQPSAAAPLEVGGAQAVAQVNAVQLSAPNPVAGSSFGLGLSPQASSLVSLTAASARSSALDSHVMGAQAAQVMEPEGELSWDDNVSLSAAPLLFAPVAPSGASVPSLTLQAGTQNALVPKSSKKALQPHKLTQALTAQRASTQRPSVQHPTTQLPPINLGFDKAGLSPLELAPTMRTFKGETLPPPDLSSLSALSDPLAQLSDVYAPVTAEAPASSPAAERAAHGAPLPEYQGRIEGKRYRQPEDFGPESPPHSMRTKLYSAHSAQLLTQLDTSLEELLQPKAAAPSTYLNLPQVSSNIQSANAVMGMVKPTIEQALKEEHDQLKQSERQLIYRLLGHNFNFDEINNVIFQVNPIFREALQNKQRELEAKNKEQKLERKLKAKQKARERYLKRQARKAQLAAEAAAFDPIKPEAITMGNDLAPVSAVKALADPLTPPLGASLDGSTSFDPTKVTAEATYSSPKVELEPLLGSVSLSPTGLSGTSALEVSPQVMTTLLSDATVTQGAAHAHSSADVLTMQPRELNDANSSLDLAAAQSYQRAESAALFNLSGSALMSQAQELTLPQREGAGSSSEDDLPIVKTTDAHCPVPAPEIRSALVEQLAPTAGVSTPKLDPKVKLK